MELNTWNEVRPVDAALKAEIQEIIELVKTIPEPLQVRALELLLEDLLERSAGRQRPKTDLDEERRGEGQENKNKEKRHRESEGLNADNLPMRVKAFMKRTKVKGEQIGRLFHVEGDQFEPIWSLTATKVSKAQVQIALLQALKRALTSGEFSFDREEVREECGKKKCYDQTNFKANFKNSGKLFSGLEKEGLVSLTDEGMAALATLIVELAGTDDGK